MSARTRAYMLGLAVLASPAFADGADPVLEFGTKVYKQFCSHCHGIDMVNPGTSSYDLRKFPQDDEARFVQSVMKGKGDMPAWGDVLLPEELEALWRYVQTRGGKEPEAADTAAATPRGDPEVAVPGTLTACLARNGGVMSSRRAQGGVGLDYALSQALADRMGLSLSVTWFESEVEENTTPVKDAYALLSYGLCDIAPGFALYQPALDRYPETRAPVPRWDDRPDSLPPNFQVDLKPIAVSDPYYRMEIGLAYREGIRIGDVRTVSDLEGLRLGVEQGTLPGLLTIRQGTERMVADAVTLNPGPAFLWEMENGRIDAALVTVGAFDFHLRQNAVSALRLHEYRHPLGFNLGVAMLAGTPILMAQVNDEIAAMLGDGTMQILAEAAHLHFAAPRAPFVQARLTIQDIVVIR